jgi:hypothetical protein
MEKKKGPGKKGRVVIHRMGGGDAAGVVLVSKLAS